MKRKTQVELLATLAFVTTLTASTFCKADEATKAVAKPDRSTIRWTCDVDASLDDAWAAFTTKEGIESWMVPIAEVDLRIGGTIKTNYNKEAGIGGPGTIVHHILSMEPKHMISSRFDAPENAQVVKIAEKSWNITYFDAINPAQTRVTLVSCGYGEGPEWDKARAFFEKGNALTLDRLKQKFAKLSKQVTEDSTNAGDRKPGPDALDLMAPLVGEWKFEKKLDDGKVFRGHAVYEKGPDGKNIVGRAELGDDSRMTPHGSVQVFRDPNSKQVRFLNLDENGGVAQGAVRVSSEKVLEWHWDLTSANGRLTRYIVRQTFTGPDEFDFQLYLRAGEPPYKELIHVTYRRVK